MASIRKRTWTSRGIERTAWVVDYFDQGGKRRLKTFATKKEADAWTVNARHEVAHGIHTPASTSITIAAAFGLWISACEADGLEFGTIKWRKELKRLHVDPFIGSEKLAILTTPGLQDFDDKLRAAGRSLAMRRKVMSNIRTMLSFCQRKGTVAQNVARAVRIKNDDKRHVAPLRA